jgi:glycosyltransferase involved in cell wall biosynthesis
MGGHACETLYSSGIKSAINQNYPHIEYSIVDSGSSDETMEILKEFPLGKTPWLWYAVQRRKFSEGMKNI